MTESQMIEYLKKISLNKNLYGALHMFFSIRQEEIKLALTSCSIEEQQRLQGQYAESRSLMSFLDDLRTNYNNQQND